LLARMTQAVVRQRVAILAAAVVLMALAGIFGHNVASMLSTAGYTSPADPSQLAATTLASQFHVGDANFVLIAERHGSVDTAAAAADGEALTAQLARQPQVTDVVSYWSAGRPSTMRSHDGQDALVTAHVAGNDEQVTNQSARLEQLFSGRRDGFAVVAAGTGVVHVAINHRLQQDLSRAEAIAFPVTFLLLVLVFRGLVAALMPLAVGAFAIVGTLAVLRVLAGFTDVSVYALNLATGLGLGLAVDYSLFVITRYREELARRRDAHGELGKAAFTDALVDAVTSAGRTVLFSSATVALSLSALLVFPLYFLRSLAYAGIGVVLIAALGAVVVLPALLATLGHRIDALTVLRRQPATAEHGFWRRRTEAVLLRPVRAGGAVLVLLLVLGAPFLSIRFGMPDDRVLPQSDPAQQAAQLLRVSFPANASNAVEVVDPTTPLGPAQVAHYAAALSRLGHVIEVRSSEGTFTAGERVAPPSRADAIFVSSRGTWLEIDPSVYAFSSAGTRLVAQVRGVPAPAHVLVGGASAELLGTEHAIGSQLPLAATGVAIATLFVMFLFTGSLVLPVKALILNVLSLSASFGAMVFIFQQGHLLFLVGHPIVTGTIDTTIPVLMFCVAFGLSMDYEVFLLSRIREVWLETGDNQRAVSLGLERTGRLISAAAVLIAVVWLAFVTSGLTFLKLLGLGMALAVVVDATLVRGVLVPAFMRLAGSWNWWAPAPLRRFHDRYGLAEPPGASAAERTVTVAVTGPQPPAAGTTNL
jgi:RND superfamily putative drug exporter